MRSVFFAAFTIVLATGISLAGDRADGSGKVDVLGGLIWARARDRTMSARFGGADGVAKAVGWGRGIELMSTAAGVESIQRSNFTPVRPNTAMAVQLRRFRLQLEDAMNSKIVLGYMDDGWRFTHGDHKDLLHWAGAARVCLYVPVRHGYKSDPADDKAYHISPYGGQTISVVEFKPGEHVQYGWYSGGPKKLDRHILLDLNPRVLDAKGLRPGLDQPIFTFDVYDKGKWRVRIERDGRDGLAGGDRDGDWDLVFTEKSKGARPYTVDVSARSAFHLTVYHPSRKSTIQLRLSGYDRSSGKPVAIDHGDRHLKDIPVADLPKTLKTLQSAPEASGQKASPSPTDKVKVTDKGGRVVLQNALVEVHVAPRRGMYVTKAIDRTTGKTICRDLKLNYPYFEHGIKTSQPAGYRVIRNSDGSVTLAMNMRFAHHKGRKEIERYGRFGDRSLSQLVTVRPGTAAFEFRGRIDNPTPLRRSNRLWDRALMPVNQQTQFIMPASHGIEHAALWIKPWPRRQITDPKTGETTWVDFSYWRNWSQPGRRMPTQYFGLYADYGFAGAFYPDEKINRLRISDPKADPGMKVYCSATGKFELWGGTTVVFEDPGHFVGGYVPTELTKHFYIASGLEGDADYADAEWAFDVLDAQTGHVHVTSPRPQDKVSLEVYSSGQSGQKLMGRTTGPVGPGKVLKVTPSDMSQAGYVAVLKDADGKELFRKRMPVEIPDRSDLYKKVRVACSHRENPHYIELQEHSNHRGMQTAMNATGAAKGLLKADDAPIERMVSIANACYRIGDFENAAALAERTIKADPENVHAHHVLGLIAFEKGRMESAVEHLAKAGPQANYLLALHHLRSGELAAAEKRLNEMIKKVPGVYRPRMLLAYLFARQKRADQAIQLARALVAENPASPEACLTLSIVAALAGREQESLQASNWAKSLSDSPDAQRQLRLFRQELEQGQWEYIGRYRFPLPEAKE